MTSSVSVMSSPSFDSRPDPQHGQLQHGDHHALTRQMIGERFARRTLALERFDRLCPERCVLGRQFILGRGRLQIFELEAPSDPTAAPYAPSASRRSSRRSFSIASLRWAISAW